MDSKNLTKIIMNPVRMRIIQYLLIHKTSTAAQIGVELSDIPKASLYRHLKVLENAGMITIVKENKKRGTVEKVYQLNQETPLGSANPDKEQIAGMVQNVLLSIMGDFGKYFAQEEVDCVKDQISLTSSTLLLSDEEFEDFTRQLGEVFNSVVKNKPDGIRKPRRISFIASPLMDGSAEQEEK